MKKTIISAALAAAIGAGGYLGIRVNSTSNEQLSDIMLANIEAIASGEDHFFSICNEYCIDSPGDVCVLLTNFDFTIDCYEMYRKY